MNPYELYAEAMQERRAKDKARAAALESAKTGGLTGALVGGVGSLLGGAPSIGRILSSAAKGGLLGGASGYGSQVLGDAIMGEPDDNEPGAYASRGLVGGAVGGGVAGAALGGLLGTGKLKWLSKVGPIAKAMEEPGALNNLATRKIREWMQKGGSYAAPRAAASLGLVGGLVGGEHGSGEGMQVDYLNALNDDQED